GLTAHRSKKKINKGPSLGTKRSGWCEQRRPFPFHPKQSRSAVLNLRGRVWRQRKREVVPRGPDIFPTVPSQYGLPNLAMPLSERPFEGNNAAARRRQRGEAKGWARGTSKEQAGHRAA